MAMHSQGTADTHVGTAQEHQDDDFMQAPVYHQKALAAAVAKAGFQAFHQYMLPSSLYSGGQQLACLKHYCGFITVRQSVNEPFRHLSEISEWKRVIIAIHDFRHEYLLTNAGNDELIAQARSRLQRTLAAWIEGVPRLKHRLTVGVTPYAGLVTIESHQINGQPDIQALLMFLTRYLEQDHLTSDIAAAFTGHEAYDVAPVRIEKSWLQKNIVEPILERWFSPVGARPGGSHI